MISNVVKIGIVSIVLSVQIGGAFADLLVGEDVKGYLDHYDLDDPVELHECFNRMGALYEPIHTDLCQWVENMEDNCEENLQLGVSFEGLWRSYQYCAGRYQEYLSLYSRVWPYDASVGLFSVMVEGDYDRAHIAVDTFMRVLRAEKKKGYRGLFHFSYNTSADSFIDPREPQGATQWVLKSIFAYMLDTGDIAYMDELIGYLRTDILPLQILGPEHPAYGLLRQGYAHPKGLDQGGYQIYEELDKLNTVAHMVNIEHNADFIDLLRLVAFCCQKYHDKLSNADVDFIDELRKRHALAMQAAVCIRKGPYWPTAFDVFGQPNWSRAIDHYTWLSHTFVDVENNEDIPWQSIQILMNEFSVVIDSMTVLYNTAETVIYFDRPLKGIYFFQQDFGDQFVAIDDEKRMRLEKMIQPEATAGAICFLQDFIKTTRHPERRKIAMGYMAELLEGLAGLHTEFKKVPGYNGSGMPYATEFIYDYFGPDPSMAATATYQIALKRLNNDYVYFLGVPVPVGFSSALTDVVNPSTLPESIPVPFFGNDEDLGTHLAAAKQEVLPSVSSLQFNDVQFGSNALTVNMSYDESIKDHLEILILKKTDVWYIQPESANSGRAGFDLPEMDKDACLKPFGRRNMDDTMLVVAMKDHGLMYNDALLDVEIKNYFEDKTFLLGTTGSPCVASDFSQINFIGTE